jgi:hypothetical protein
MLIETPSEFKKLCRNLVQGLEFKSADDLVLIALSGLEPGERAAIGSFLDKLLASEFTPDQLKDYWWSLPADIVFYEGEKVLVFLRLLRSALP